MPIVRIQSVYIDGAVEKEDVMVFDAFIGNDGFVKPMELFGYAIEDGDKWPMTIKQVRKVGVLEWGAGDEGTTTSLNLFEKRIAVGEYFTRTDITGNETANYTYKITRIFNWDELT